MNDPDFDLLIWNNLHADIYLGLHSNAMHLYIESIVDPSLNAIESRHDELASSEDPVAAFLMHDIEELLTSAIEAFALSIQSMWERQFRAFLKGCATELRLADAYVAQLERDQWPQLVERFAEMRGLALSAFDSFSTLEVLQLVGNVCRHGDGQSAKKLFERRPDLWSQWPPALPAGWPGPSLVVPSYPPFSHFSMRRAVLTELAQAVGWFWDDHNYIYTNSILRRDRNVDSSLEEMRARRAHRRR